MVNFDRVREPRALFCQHDDSRRTNHAGTLNFKRRHDSSLSRSAFILSPVYLLIFTSALQAVGLTVVFIGKRRQEQAVGEFSDQLGRLTPAASTVARIALEGKTVSLDRLAAAVNQLLESLEQRGADLHGREQLFQRLVETVHYAVLVHRQRILFANSRFLSLLGLTAPDVVGRHLSDFVGPEYVELVYNNLQRRLDGEPSAERYEVELVGAHGEVTRVELSSALIDSDGEPGFLLTGLKMLPEASTPPNGSAARPRAVATLDAMGESVVTVDAGGRIDYINTAAEAPLGQALDPGRGKSVSGGASL